MDTVTASEYGIVRNKPVLKFRYKGSHRSPVRRTLLAQTFDRGLVTGLEVREGNTTRCVDNAPIKSFRKEDIIELDRFAITGDSPW